MMKKLFSLRSALVLAALAISVFALPARAGEATAFDLIKEGNRFVSEDAKDKVVEIRSEKSVASLVPNIWYIIYYDADATFKATEVKFSAGKKDSVKRPGRLWEMVSGNKPIDRAKLKIDSDAAIATAKKEPILEKLTLTNTQLKLDTDGEGALVWKVRLWATKIRRPTETTDIGEVRVSAETGKVVKTDLHIDRVD